MLVIVKPFQLDVVRFRIDAPFKGRRVDDLRGFSNYCSHDIALAKLPSSTNHHEMRVVLIDHLIHERSQVAYRVLAGKSIEPGCLLP